MEPPVAASGPVLRRSATFSHRQERALKDVNGRVSVVNKSQEHLSTVKSTADGQKVGRPAKQYSAVASRYAAPLASKKQPPAIGNGPQAGQSNMTKLPFITGRAAPSHQRRPSTDNLSSFNPPMVFSAFPRDARPDTLAKKAMEDSNSLSAKRPRATTSMIEQKTQLQARGPRFYSLDKGGCLCSKKGSVRGSVEVSGAGTVSLLYSAAHWLFLIKLAEEEKKHDVVVELFRLALTLKAEPSEDVKVQLKLYQESHPTEEVARRLLEKCEGVMQVEMASTTVEAGREGQFNSEESNISVTNLARVDTGVSTLGKITVVPLGLSKNGAATDKDVMGKRPHFMGRMLSRSSTFSVVDPNSKSVHAKAEYSKKLLKTIDFLASQAAAHSHSNANPLLQPSPLEAQPPLDCVPNAGAIRKSPSKSEIREGFDVPAFDMLSTPLPSFQTSSPSSVELATLGFESTSTIVAVALEASGIFSMGSTPSNNGTLVSETESKPLSSLSKDWSEKPVDSLSEWLDDKSSQMGTPDMQSAPSEENLDLTPNGGQAVKEMDVDSLTKAVVSHTLPEGISITAPESSAAQRNVASSPVPSHGRRQSWQCIGDQSLIPSVEKLNVFHRHTLNADAGFLSVHCNGERSLLSVEEKVKLFTELAEVRGTIPAVSKMPVHGSKETGGDAVEEFKEAVHVDENSNQAAKDDNCEPPVEFVVEMEPNVVITPGIDSPMIASAEIESSGRSEASESTLVTPLPVYSPKMSLKGDTRPLSATPIAVTPSQPASVGNPRTRHRRASSVGNLTPRVPFDISAESSPFGDYTCSLSSQSSSAKSKLTSRGYKEVTPRMHLPKPSWKAIVEREMKGSKLKDLLAAQLPKETSPLSEYLEIQMGNQSRNAENGTIGSSEKIVNLTRSPAKPLRGTTVSSALKQVVPTEEQHETGEVLRSAQLLRGLNEC